VILWVAGDPRGCPATPCCCPCPSSRGVAASGTTIERRKLSLPLRFLRVAGDGSAGGLLRAGVLRRLLRVLLEDGGQEEVGVAAGGLLRKGDLLRRALSEANDRFMSPTTIVP
jgi:hypothetical protein